MRKLFAAMVFCCAALTAACGGGSEPQPFTPGPLPTPTPTPFNGKLYVAYGTAGTPLARGIAVYALPLTSGSAPLFTLSASFGTMAFDRNGDLYTAAQNEIDVYGTPLDAQSTPQPLITAGPASLPSAVSDLQFDDSGNLWVQTINDLREFPAPVSAGESATTIVPGAGASLSFDPVRGALYDGPMSFAFGVVPSVKIYAAFPYTVPPKTVSPPFGAPIGFDPSGNALVYTNNYVVNGALQPPGLALTGVPITSGSVPQFTVPIVLYPGQSYAHPAAIDPLGDVYAVDNTNAVIQYTAPFAEGSMPTASVPCVTVGASCVAALSVAIGP